MQAKYNDWNAASPQLQRTITLICLYCLYAKHNPTKLADWPVLTEKYRGKETAWLRSMQAKYNDWYFPF